MGEQIDCVPDTGDTAWMMAATAFVMIQTPALGLVQAGMIRRKNSLAMLLQTLAGMAIGSLLWFVFGFSLTFGEDHGGFIGDLDYAFFIDVDMEKCFAAGPTIPTTIYALFQMMFALMVPVIVTGAWAEKLNFRAFLVFTTLWPIFAYYPLAHWVWGGGWLSKLGVIDFAGGITIHTNAGVAALVVALVMGRRRGGDTIADIHHNIPLTIVGGAFIWFGWFGFNGGSSIAANATGSVAYFNTHLAACTAAMTWMALAFASDSHFHLTEFMNGAFAGLAGVTPGSGFMLPYGAWCTGIIVAAGAFATSRFLKGRVQLDDVLDVSSLQGTPGILGSLLAGCFATAESSGGVDGAWYGRPILLAYQLVGVMVAIIWSAFWTYVIMKFLEHTIGIYVSLETLKHGQDATETGESAYDGDDPELKADHTYIGVLPEDKHKKGALTFGTHPVEPSHRR